MKEIKFMKFVSKVDSFGDPIHILFDFGSSKYNLYDPVEKKIIDYGFLSLQDAIESARCLFKIKGFWTLIH